MFKKYFLKLQQVKSLLLNNSCKNIIKKLIWKFIDIFLSQVLNFLNIFTEHGKKYLLVIQKAKKEFPNCFIGMLLL